MAGHAGLRKDLTTTRGVPWQGQGWAETVQHLLAGGGCSQQHGCAFSQQLVRMLEKTGLPLDVQAGGQHLPRLKSVKQPAGCLRFLQHKIQHDLPLGRAVLRPTFQQRHGYFITPTGPQRCGGCLEIGNSGPGLHRLQQHGHGPDGLSS